MTIYDQRLKAAVVCLCSLLLFTVADGQKRPGRAKLPPKEPVYAIKVTRLDDAGLKGLLRPKDKPLLINFWATWCDPCREEFPELVKLDSEYKGRIDFLTISLDYLSEIDRDVPKFLTDMKAEMPAYLLKTDDESKAISTVTTEWNGALPFTILIDASGGVSYFRQGKISPETVR